MRIRSSFLAILAVWVAAGIAPAAASDRVTHDLQERLRHRLEVLDEPGELQAGGEILYAASALAAFYEGRAWQPAWVAPADRSDGLLAELLAAIESSYDQGLVPADYHLDRLRIAAESLSSASPGVGDRVDLELLASDAFLTLADHLANGKVDPESIDPDWFLARPAPELVSVLSGAVAEGGSPARALDGLLPDADGYRRLVARLTAQRRMLDDEEWMPIDIARLLRPDDTDAAIPALRQQLRRLGDLGPEGAATSGDRYDRALEQAIRRFQARHGLDPDGVVGPRTLAQLNATPAQRIDRIRANLERWRWLPRSLGDEYILVNIAGFRLELVSAGERVLERRVIVGLPYRRTPVFSGRMTYLVLNPSWEVPHRLAVQDKLPLIAGDPGYLARLGFSVLQGWGAEERVVDPAGVDWSQLSRAHFPYRLRQAPGPENALGRVKFMFPNEHNVYLHDTPARGLFAESERTFSSGCIRVEDPLPLAEWLLSGPGRTSAMTPEEVDAAVAGGRETTVTLPRPVAVHLLYWTAWVEDDGTVQYRRDVYDRDTALIEALGARLIAAASSR